MELGEVLSVTGVSDDERLLAHHVCGNKIVCVIRGLSRTTYWAEVFSLMGDEWDCDEYKATGTLEEAMAVYMRFVSRLEEA